MSSFLNSGKVIITSMVQADNPDRIKELMEKSAVDGAEAFGLQFEQLKAEYRSRETYEELFSFMPEKPKYVTNYRGGVNVGKTDEILSSEMMELAKAGATLCDVMGDFYDRQPGELTMDKDNIKKQEEYISRLHEAGAEVLMSSHVMRFTPAERVMEIAFEHKKRGADICKIVTGASSQEEQIENLRIVNMLKKELGIPFLFLATGKSNILRRIGGDLGCVMYLCVHEHDRLATPDQPLISEVLAIRKNLRQVE